MDCMIWPWPYSVLQRFFRGFRSLSPHFVLFIHGERGLSSLPCLGGAAVQISLKIGECCVADVISSRMAQFLKEPLIQKNLQHIVHFIPLPGLKRLRFRTALPTSIILHCTSGQAEDLCLAGSVSGSERYFLQMQM